MQGARKYPLAAALVLGLVIAVGVLVVSSAYRVGIKPAKAS